MGKRSCIDDYRLTKRGAKGVRNIKLKEGDYGVVSDISILIENSARRPNLKFTFTECFPIALSGVNLDVTGSDVIYPEVSVTMRYTNMRFEKIS